MFIISIIKAFCLQVMLTLLAKPVTCEKFFNVAINQKFFGKNSCLLPPAQAEGTGQRPPPRGAEAMYPPPGCAEVLSSTQPLIRQCLEGLVRSKQA